MRLSRRALLRLLILTPPVLMAACFDDEKLEDLIPPTRSEHFILAIAAEGDSPGSDGQSVTRVAFVEPDTWEIWNGGSLFPDHVILSGLSAWEATALGWRPYQHSDRIRTTLLAGALAFEDFRRDLRSSGAGPLYGGEATQKYVVVTGEVDERIERSQDRVGVPLVAAATVNATFEDSRVRIEVHIGVNSKLVHFCKVSTVGPNINVSATYTFDYKTPVSITVPR